MIGRIVWFSALAAIALLTVAVQFDARSVAAPAFARLVPEPLRNYAQVHIAADAFAAGDEQAALAEVRKLVHRRPIPPEHLALLAVAQIGTGQPERATQTIQIAGQRGWREPLTQEAVLRIALGAGDEAEAARRYAAMLVRNHANDDLLKALGPEVFAGAGGTGEQTMIALVADAERWRARFLRRGSQVMPPLAYARIVSGAIDRGVAIDCALLGQSIQILAPRDAGAAEQLARAAAKTCPALAPRGAAPL